MNFLQIKISFVFYAAVNRQANGTLYLFHTHKKDQKRTKKAFLSLKLYVSSCSEVTGSML